MGELRYPYVSTSLLFNVIFCFTRWDLMQKGFLDSPWCTSAAAAGNPVHTTMTSIKGITFSSRQKFTINSEVERLYSRLSKQKYCTQ